MNITFDKTFSPQFDAIIATEPTDSITVYCYPGAIEGGFVDGISIEIFPENSDPWFASFAEGRGDEVGVLGDGSQSVVVPSGASPTETDRQEVGPKEQVLFVVINVDDALWNKTSSDQVNRSSLFTP